MAWEGAICHLQFFFTKGFLWCGRAGGLYCATAGQQGCFVCFVYVPFVLLFYLFCFFLCCHRAVGLCELP